jgi:SAM-dependent methyltransferase
MVQKEKIGVLDTLRTRLRRETFRPTLFSVIIGSSFISRRGLFCAIKRLAPSITGNVLDFGCGSKPYEALFINADSYIGTDLEITGHDHIDSKVDVFYDGGVLSFPDGAFDAVVSFEVFEHVFNLPDILKEINRVTKDSGLLLISMPFAWGEHETPYDYARYTSFGISHILKRGGYEVLEVKKTTTFLLAVCQMFINYLVQLGPRSWILRPLLQLFVIFPVTLIAYAINAVVPKRYEYFSNIVVLARKCATSE